MNKPISKFWPIWKFNYQVTKENLYDVVFSRPQDINLSQSIINNSVGFLLPLKDAPFQITLDYYVFYFIFV